MENLFEVVFESVSKDRVVQLLIHLISCASQSIEIECTENIALMVNGRLSVEGLESVLHFNGDLCVLIRLQQMKAGSVVLPKVLLRLVKYGDSYDVDFNFDLSEPKNVPLSMKYLHMFAIEIAKDFEAKNIFGGMEPASDDNTRYFTNQKAGPLTE